MRATVDLTHRAEDQRIATAHCTEHGETRSLRYWPGSDVHTAILTLDPFQTRACVRYLVDVASQISPW